MKRTYTALVALTLVLACLLSACGSSVKNDVPVSELCDGVETALSGETEFVDIPESYITSKMKLDLTTLPEYTLKMNSRGVNIDEYGILKANDEAQAVTVEAGVREYLQNCIDTWMVEYMPEEFPKLENAEVRVVGNYVMYAILSDSDKAAAFSAFENALKG